MRRRRPGRRAAPPSAPRRPTLTNRASAASHPDSTLVRQPSRQVAARSPGGRGGHQSPRRVPRWPTQRGGFQRPVRRRPPPRMTSGSSRGASSVPRSQSDSSGGRSGVPVVTGYRGVPRTASARVPRSASSPSATAAAADAVAGQGQQNRRRRRSDPLVPAASAAGTTSGLLGMTSRDGGRRGGAQPLRPASVPTAVIGQVRAAARRECRARVGIPAARSPPRGGAPRRSPSDRLVQRCAVRCSSPVPCARSTSSRAPPPGSRSSAAVISAGRGGRRGTAAPARRASSSSRRRSRSGSGTAGRQHQRGSVRVPARRWFGAAPGAGPAAGGDHHGSVRIGGDGHQRRPRRRRRPVGVIDDQRRSGTVQFPPQGGVPGDDGTPAARRPSRTAASTALFPTADTPVTSNLRRILRIARAAQTTRVGGLRRQLTDGRIR